MLSYSADGYCSSGATSPSITTVFGFMSPRDCTAPISQGFFVWKGLKTMESNEDYLLNVKVSQSSKRNVALCTVFKLEIFMQTTKVSIQWILQWPTTNKEMTHNNIPTNYTCMYLYLTPFKVYFNDKEFYFYLFIFFKPVCFPNKFRRSDYVFVYMLHMFTAAITSQMLKMLSRKYILKY